MEIVDFLFGELMEYVYFEGDGEERDSGNIIKEKIDNLEKL